MTSHHAQVQTRQPDSSTKHKAAFVIVTGYSPTLALDDFQRIIKELLTNSHRFYVDPTTYLPHICLLAVLSSHISLQLKEMSPYDLSDGSSIYFTPIDIETLHLPSECITNALLATNIAYDPEKHSVNLRNHIDTYTFQKQFTSYPQFKQFQNQIHLCFDRFVQLIFHFCSLIDEQIDYLDLSANNLSSIAQFQIAPCFPSLSTLILDDNSLQSVEDFSCLSHILTLQSVSIANNPVCLKRPLINVRHAISTFCAVPVVLSLYKHSSLPIQCIFSENEAITKNWIKTFVTALENPTRQQPHSFNALFVASPQVSVTVSETVCLYVDPPTSPRVFPSSLIDLDQSTSSIASPSTLLEFIAKFGLHTHTIKTLDAVPIPITAQEPLFHVVINGLVKQRYIVEIETFAFFYTFILVAVPSPGDGPSLAIRNADLNYSPTS
ncbi:hypothetical protein BLNAU_18755 [Blattamonas nauphoetae]|uniref:NTF2 domain-containing protein n=1 Tax=Blattamonas nauphoetae TaxID=2049346 RepID=A0ABQ9X3N3_9EUKA|nr:hypothetical protein BLNAU_18755 [Blattamonas nauphoetae]